MARHSKTSTYIERKKFFSGMCFTLVGALCLKEERKAHGARYIDTPPGGLYFTGRHT